jgi:hypothetical protein
MVVRKSASRKNMSRVRRTTIAVGLAAALVVGGCSGPGGGGGGGGGTTTTTEVPAPPDPFTGTLDEFYEVPDPLPEGSPGDLIRLMPVSGDDVTTTVRVMYHSVDGQGADRAVTGIVTYPNAPAPEGGWPVVAWAHGTTGLASPCAPSRGGGPAPAFGVEGVRVATDYIGLGPVGERHPYLSGPSEAHSVVDAVRAARRLPATGAGSRWVAAGHSQGGHAALFTNELGASYAPELELLGTASMAPAAVFEERFGPADQVIPHMVGVMGLYGLEAENPDIDVDDYISDQVAAADDVIDTGCLGDIVNALVGIPLETFFDASPYETEPAMSAMRANDPGQVAVDAPLLLAYGAVDTWVVPARVEHLFGRLCEVGQVTELAEIADTDHSVSPAMNDRVSAWFEARFAGEPVTDSC